MCVCVCVCEREREREGGGGGGDCSCVCLVFFWNSGEDEFNDPVAMAFRVKLFTYGCHRRQL